MTKATLAKVWRAVGGSVASVARTVYEGIGREDVLSLAGLALIITGLWEVSRAAALVIPGAVLLWVALPPRPPFTRG